MCDCKVSNCVRAHLHMLALKLGYADNRAERQSTGTRSAIAMIASERASYRHDLETTKNRIYDLISVIEGSNRYDVELIDVEIDEDE